MFCAGAGQTRAMPMFIVASAAEAKPSAAANSSVPQWQRVAANLAAGAAAGCSVEAGEQQAFMHWAPNKTQKQINGRPIWQCGMQQKLAQAVVKASRLADPAPSHT